MSQQQLDGTFGTSSEVEDAPDQPQEENPEPSGTFVPAKGDTNSEASAVNTSVSTDERGTPTFVIQTLIQYLGCLFDLDAAAGAEETTIAKKAYTEAENGLAKPWHGKVWLNPPYSDMPTWLEKAVSESKQNRTEFILVMIPSYGLSTQWYHDYVTQASIVAAIEGRLSFSNTDGAAGFASLIVGFGDVPDGVRDALRELGAILRTEATTKDLTNDQSYLFELTGSTATGPTQFTTRADLTELMFVHRGQNLKLDLVTDIPGVPTAVPSSPTVEVLATEIRDGRRRLLCIDTVREHYYAIVHDLADKTIAAQDGETDGAGYISVSWSPENGDRIPDATPAASRWLPLQYRNLYVETSKQSTTPVTAQ